MSMSRDLLNETLQSVCIPCSIGASKIVRYANGSLVCAPWQVGRGKDGACGGGGGKGTGVGGGIGAIM